MGLPKTKLLMTSTLLACTSTGQPPTPHGILCSPSSVPAPAAAFVSATLLGMTTGQFSYALKSKLPGGLCLIIIGTEGGPWGEAAERVQFPGDRRDECGQADRA